jgi:cardiolipin synthase
VDAAPVTATTSSRILTVPNVITVLRLACIPVFWWLLLGLDEPVAAAVLLAALGATDWVDGFIARRYDQVSELGKVLDPTADRILFITCLLAIMIDGAVPRWLCLAVIVREVVVGGAMVIATFFFGMQRFDVQWIGKLGTALLLIAFPLLLAGSGDSDLQAVLTFAGWCVAIPGLVVSYYAAITYVPLMRAGLAEGRKANAR